MNFFFCEGKTISLSSSSPLLYPLNFHEMADPVAGLGMSLDDIIASKKSETGAGRGRGRGGFRGRGGGGDRGGGRFGAGGRGGGHLGARPMSASGISKASSAPANVRVIIPVSP